MKRYLFTAVMFVLLSCGGGTKQVVKGEEQVPAQAQAAQAKPTEEEEELVERQVVVPKEPMYVEGVDREAQDAFRQGVIAISKTPPDYQAARSYFESAVQKDKHFLEAYFNLGMVYERTGEPEKAVQVYQRALDANPDNLDAQAYIGKTYLTLSKRAKELGDKAKALDYETKAKQIFDSILAKDPDNVATNNAMALYHLYRGDMRTAEDFVTKVLMVEPKNVVALNTRGLINLMSGKLAIARWVFEEKALKEDPHSTEAWTNLGVTYMKMGKTPEAVASFEKALEFDPDNVPALLNVAAIYLQYLHYQAALDQYERVLKLVPDNVEAMVGASSCLLGLKRPQDAVRKLENALKVEPNNGAVWARLGKIYETYLGQVDKAIDAYEQYVKVTNAPPSDPVASKLQALKQMRQEGGLKAPELPPQGEGGGQEPKGEGGQ
jgi:tetratricopeptide (TPR) repeat protein